LGTPGKAVLSQNQCHVKSITNKVHDKEAEVEKRGKKPGARGKSEKEILEIVFGRLK